MNQVIKQKECRNLGCDVLFTPFKSTDKFCSYVCAKTGQNPRKSTETKSRTKIQPMSQKRKKENAIYLKTRIEFLNEPENKICFIDGCDKSATTVEHTAGRIGTKYLDQKFWKPCCLKHNLELENNPEMSNKYQLSKIHDGKKINKSN
jgi:hypothetical protein